MFLEGQDVFLSDKKYLALRGSFGISQLIPLLGLGNKRLPGLGKKLKEGKEQKANNAAFVQEIMRDHFGKTSAIAHTYGLFL